LALPLKPAAQPPAVPTATPAKSHTITRHSAKPASKLPSASITKMTPPKSDDGVEKQNSCAWEKPEWAKTKVLKRTNQGEVLKKQGSLQAPITNISAAVGDKKNLAFEKPDWTKKNMLRGTKKGEKLMNGDYISRPIGGIKPIDS
jgi:hypothetical protein